MTEERNSTENLYQKWKKDLFQYDFQINDPLVFQCNVIALSKLKRNKGTRAVYKLTEKHVRSCIRLSLFGITQRNIYFE